MLNNIYLDDEYIEEKLYEIKKKEKIEGIEPDYFISLVNMSKEYMNSYSVKKILKTWVRYREYIEKIDFINENINLADIDTSILDINIDNLLKTGGIIFTFHYSNYRFLETSIAKKIREESEDLLLAVVIDQESYNNENENMKKIHDTLGIEYILAESSKSIYRMKKILKENGVIIVYIDGNTGSGSDSKNLIIDLNNSKINVRSGSFRLLAIMNKPFYPAISNGQSVNLYDGLYVEKDTILASAEKLYTIFEGYLQNAPYLWRFWYRHHTHINQWNKKTKESNNEKKEIWYSKTKNANKFALEVETGRVFKMDI